jgi:hypothetical protein
LTEVDKKDLEALKDDLERGFVLMRLPDCNRKNIGEAPGALAIYVDDDDNVKLAFKKKSDGRWYASLYGFVKL